MRQKKYKDYIKKELIIFSYFVKKQNLQLIDPQNIYDDTNFLLMFNNSEISNTLMFKSLLELPKNSKNIIINLYINDNERTIKSFSTNPKSYARIRSQHARALNQLSTYYLFEGR